MRAILQWTCGNVVADRALGELDIATHGGSVDLLGENCLCQLGELDCIYLMQKLDPGVWLTVRVDVLVQCRIDDDAACASVVVVVVVDEDRLA